MMLFELDPATYAHVFATAAAGIGAAYAAFLRPRLAQEVMVAEAIAIRDDISADVGEGFLPPADPFVVGAQVFLMKVVEDPYEAVCELRGHLRNRQLTASGAAPDQGLSATLRGADVAQLSMYWQQVAAAVSRFRVDGSPWWPIRRLLSSASLDAPMAILTSFVPPYLTPVSSLVADHGSALSRPETEPGVSTSTGRRVRLPDQPTWRDQECARRNMDLDLSESSVVWTPASGAGPATTVLDAVTGIDVSVQEVDVTDFVRLSEAYMQSPYSQQQGRPSQGRLG